MEDLIRFKVRIDSLSEEELFSFIKSQDHKYLIDTFFNSLVFQFITMKDSSVYDTNLIQIQEMIANIDNIIHSRDHQQQTYSQNDHDILKDVAAIKHPHSRQSIKLSQLASPLISHISNYLELSDILSFELVSRNILIGSRSPISSHIMLYDQFQKCLEFSNNTKFVYNWYRFKNVQSLYLHLQHTFNEYYHVAQATNDPKLRKGRDIEMFRKLPIFKNLKHLGLHYDDEDGNYFCKWLFGDLLNTDCFPNLEYLSIKSLRIQQNDPMASLLPQLQGLSVDALCLSDYIADNISMDKITAFQGGEGDLQQLITRRAHQIEECCLCCATNMFSELFLQLESFPDLKRVCLHFHENMPVNIQEQSDIYFGGLKYIVISCTNYNDLECVLDMFLNPDLNFDHDSNTIKMRIIAPDQVISMRIKNKIIRVVDFLNSEYEHVMLSLLIKEIDGSLGKIKNGGYLVKTDDEKYCHISNDDCSLSDFTEDWLMKCSKCL